jgi:hypothetical protein
MMKTLRIKDVSMTTRDSSRRVRAGAAVLGLALTFCVGAADDRRAAVSTLPLDSTTASQERTHMWMTIGAQRFAVTLEDNPSARAFMQLLPVTLDMADLNNNEKHATLARSLPTDTVRPGTIRAGDVLLYGKDTLVVFYETFRSSYSYTRIGRINESAGLAQALGPGNQRVTFTAP